MSSFSGVLYIGVTDNLKRRTKEHKEGLVAGFSKKYHTKSLVYHETYNNINEALVREKQLKRWRREKKLNLIRTLNPEFKDLSQEFGF